MKHLLSLVALSILFFSCNEKKLKNIDTSNIAIDFKFVDFHNLYYQSNTDEFQKLKKKYPYLFPKQIHDSIWKLKKINKEELFLYDKVDSVFGDLSNEKQKLKQLFKNIKYYIPNFKSPKTISLITNLDYVNKVVYADSLLFISLDMYLGNKNEVYSSFPKYISEKHNKEYLWVDITKVICNQQFEIPNGSTFLDHMIHKGKELYLFQSLLPTQSELYLTGYSPKKLNWAQTNESFIWSYFIENQLLFSTDKRLNKRFIDPAPFSKFYLDLDSQTPGQIGAWIGWKIVCSYVKNNDTFGLLDLLKTDSETIFRKSKYKPKK